MKKKWSRIFAVAMAFGFTLCWLTAAWPNQFRISDGIVWNKLATLPETVYSLAVSGQNIFAGTSSGVYRSSDGGLVWNRHNGSVSDLDTIWCRNNPSCTAYSTFSVAIDPKTLGTVYAATANGVYKSLDAGIVWNRFNTSTASLKSNGPYSAKAVVVGQSGEASAAAGSAVYTSLKNLYNGSRPLFDTYAPVSGTVNRLIYDERNPSRIYAQTSEQIYKSDDKGVTWNGMGTISGINMISIATDPFNDNTVYAGTSNGVFRKAPGDSIWVSIGLPGKQVFALYLYPEKSGIISAATDQGVFETVNGGSSWFANGTLVNAAINGMFKDAVAAYANVYGVSGGAIYKGAVVPGFALTPKGDTLEASAIASTSATLNGLVSSNNDNPSTVMFEYGLSTSYGTTVNAGTADAAALNTPVSFAVSGLTCGTRYHYRIKVANNAGSYDGIDKTFVTASCPIAGRCGTANKGIFTVAPATDLCDSSVGSTIDTTQGINGIVGSGPWSWTCNGMYGGIPDQCLAYTALQGMTVTKAGSGRGTVATDSGSLSWADNTGTATYSTGTPVKLTAQADPGSAFTGWSGACTGTQPTCTIAMTEPRNVGATFADTAAPMITLSTLASGSGTTNPVINLSGTITDNIQVQSLTIDGTPVAVTPDGSFNTPVVLDPDNGTINTVATDSAGNQTTDARTVTFDQLLPTLSVSAPADNSTTNKNYYKVTGTITDPTATVTVTVNGGPPQLAAITGTGFSATVNLKAGFNTIQTTVTDLNNKKNSLKRTVISDSQHATVAITTPIQDLETTTAALTLKGSVTSAVTPVAVSIAAGGNTYTPVISSAGAFSQALTFTEPKLYPIIVTVTESNGTVTTVQRNILFERTNVLKTATSPTKTPNLTCSGTRESGTTVSIDCPTVTTVGTVNYPTATTWSCPLTGLAEGKNPLTVTFTAATNPEMTASKIIIFDTMAPTEGSLAATSEYGMVKLSWSGFSDTNSGISSYKVYASTTTFPGTCSGTPIYSGTATSYSHTGLSNGTSYYYRLCASDKAGNISTGITASASPNLYPLSITTTSPLSGPVSKTYIATLTATGGVQPYTWSLASGTLPTGLTLNATTGTISGTPTIVGSYAFTVKAKDSQAAAAAFSKAFTLNITPQPLAISTTSLTGANLGSSTSKSVTVTGGVKPYRWSLASGTLPPGLGLNATTGYISGTPTSIGNYSFTVKVTDSQALPFEATRELSIDVAVGPLTISTSSLSNATLGSSASKSISATGGIKPYSWSLATGSLPPGLSQNPSTGTISGTPTMAGSFSFTVKVSDNQVPSVSASKAFSLNVVIGSLSITSTSPLTSATIGVSYSKSIIASGGIKPYIWSLAGGSLPPGIILNSATGYISGKPTAAGSYSFSLKVTDSQGTPTTATKDFSLTVL
ncbi:putative Ig domain-containing protein [Geobacter pelophilus]|uniref:Ig domain-containing protein n=1 Tax=Geoanaerobacter pelophilus TaxID=60036 RepID=A0AAW4L1K2_9BACT|nr:putative Ig domain-containing protein [Geoanaerobacter pelophilus]MBT0664052.1 putative Ig domain-containing protein [Geoanaerobacter pelophilus]